MTFRLRHLEPDQRSDRYDLVIVAAGFETRARYISEAFRISGAKMVAFGFSDRQELAFDENVAWFEANGFDVQVASDPEFQPKMRSLLELISASKPRESLTVFVDISSFSRSRIASIVCELNRLGRAIATTAHFLYNIGVYSNPVTNPLSINTHAGPVSREFAGWSARPDLPPIAFVGMGYEEGKALGAVEYLQADEIWAFDPISPIEEYRPVLKEANAQFLELVAPSRRLSYKVVDPIGLFEQLEALIYAGKRAGRPHILPFGPKIFTLVGLLVALLHNEASVWRVSAGSTEPASDRLPSIHTVGLEVQFGATL